MLASDYGNLANTFGALGDLQGALKMNQQALEAFSSIGSRRGSASVMNNLGDLFGEMGHPEEAKGYYQKALALDRETGYSPAARDAAQPVCRFVRFAYPLAAGSPLRRENAAMNLTHLYLSPKGRIGRKTFWIGVGGLIGWGIVVFVVLWTLLGPSLIQNFLGRLVGFPFTLLTIYFGYNLAAKRLTIETARSSMPRRLPA